jgi:signal transduction histidine kinase
LSAGWQTSGHYGVIGMKERAEALGGTLEMRSSAEDGLSVIARIPVGTVPAA